MQDNLQRTIAKPVSFNGIGLHSGQKSSITIFPGKDNQGIVFKRVDLNENNLIEAVIKMFHQQSFALHLKMNSE